MQAKTRTAVLTPRAMLLWTLLVGAALTLSAHAQEAKVEPPAPVATAPAPQRGAEGGQRIRLSAAQVQEAFQYIDSNRDGALSRGEVGVFPRIEKHFERIDSNRDGAISPAEFEEALQQAS